MWKRVLRILIIIIVTSNVSTGCMGVSKVVDNDDDIINEQYSTKEGQIGDSNFNKTGLPIVNDKVTITVMVPAENDLNEKTFFRDLEERTNIHVKWETIPYSQTTEKKNLMFASGVYPDAMGGWLLEKSDILTYGPRGAFIKIDDYIDEGYMPYLESVFEKWPELERVIRTPDGHIYSLPIAAKQPLTKAVTLINKTWLDGLGLTIPTTTEEFYTVLKSFKENDPNGNGIPDEIPFSFMYNDANSGHRDHFGSFGRVDNLEHKVIEDGKVVFTAMHPEYKEAIKYFNQLFTEGLIDKEAITQNGHQYKLKGIAEPMLYGAFSNWDGHVIGYDKSMEHYVPLPPLKGPEGYQSWNEGDPSIFATQFAITTAAKYPEIVVRWIDEFFETETSIRVFYGPSLEKQVDGKYKKVLLPDGMTNGEFVDSDTFRPLPYAILPETQVKIEQDIEGIWKSQLDEVYQPYIVTEKFPQIWFTPEEQQELSILETDIIKYVDDKQAAWIVGDSSIDAEWESYLEDLEKMGINRWIEIQQNAVDRYYGKFSYAKDFQEK